MRRSAQWLMLDSETGEMKQIRAHNQREAIKISLSHGVVPRKSDDVRPRTGDGELMSPEEFEEFMDKLRS